MRVRRARRTAGLLAWFWCWAAPYSAAWRARFRSKDISQGGGLQQALAQRQGPSLLVWGEHDVTADPEVIASALAASLPDGRAHVVKDAGHWVQFERADEVNALLRNECQASL